MLFLAGCGASETSFNSPSLNPAIAQTQPGAQSGSFDVMGRFEGGTFCATLTPGRLPEQVLGEGVVVRGPESAPDIQPVSITGTRIGSELALDLAPQDPDPNSPDMFVMGTMGGDATLAEEASPPRGQRMSLSGPLNTDDGYDAIISDPQPKIRVGPGIELAIQCLIEPGGDYIVSDKARPVNIKLAFPGYEHNLGLTGTWTSDVPVTGIPNGVTAGKAYIDQWPDGTIRAQILDSHSGVGYFSFPAPRSDVGAQRNLGSASYMVVPIAAVGTNLNYHVGQYTRGTVTVTNRGKLYDPFPSPNPFP